MPAAAWKTPLSLIHVTKFKERHLLVEKKAPAAAGKTSPSLIHVTTNPGTSFLPKKKAPAAAGKTSTELPPPKRKGQMTFPHVQF